MLNCSYLIVDLSVRYNTFFSTNFGETEQRVIVEAPRAFVLLKDV